MASEYVIRERLDELYRTVLKFQNDTSPDMQYLIELVEEVQLFQIGSFNLEKKTSATAETFATSYDFSQQILLKLTVAYHMFKYAEVFHLCVSHGVAEDFAKQLMELMRVGDSYMQYMSCKCLAEEMVVFPTVFEANFVGTFLSSCELLPKNIQVFLVYLSKTKEEFSEGTETFVLQILENIPVLLTTVKVPSNFKEDIINVYVLKIIKKIWKYLTRMEVIYEGTKAEITTPATNALLQHFSTITGILDTLPVQSETFSAFLSLLNKVFACPQQKSDPNFISIHQKVWCAIEKRNLLNEVNLPGGNCDEYASDFCGICPTVNILKCKQQIVLIILRISAQLTRSGVAEWRDTLDLLFVVFGRATFASSLVALFADEDDTLLEALVCLLEVVIWRTNLQDKETDTADRADGDLEYCEPHRMFLAFSSAITYDSDTLLDLLTSPETRCLLYLTKYLKYLSSTWIAFVNCTKVQLCADSTQKIEYKEIVQTVAHVTEPEIQRLVNYDDSSESEGSGTESNDRTENKGKKREASEQVLVGVKPRGLNVVHATHDTETYQNPVLDKNMSMLIRLRFAIEKLQAKDLLGYNPNPLLKLLVSAEHFYDQKGF